jgi:hypothetical protein
MTGASEEMCINIETMSNKSNKL